MSGEAYAGDVSASEAWSMLANDQDTVLVDVRTRPEWQFVGVPDLSTLGRRPLLLSWQEYPSMARNDGFTSTLREAGAPIDATILFICRSGARSRAAAIAATEAGFARCLNVVGGFEGDLDADRHRGRSNGWKAAGLPWVQE